MGEKGGDPTGVIGALVSLLSTLTIWRVVLALVLGGGGLLLYALLETRTQWAPLLWQSPLVMAAAGIGCIALLGWALASSVHARMRGELSRAQEQLEQQTDELVGKLERQVEQQAGMLREQQRELYEVIAQERECRVRVSHLQSQVVELQRRADSAGGVSR